METLLQHLVERGMRILPESSWRPVLLISVDAFYQDRHEDGISACLTLLNDPALPDDIRELTYRNQTFYARPLAELVSAVETRPVATPAPEGWLAREVSVAAAGEWLLLFVRMAEPEPGGEILDVIFALDGVLETHAVGQIGRESEAMARLREIRLFVAEDGMHAAALLETDGSAQTLAAVVDLDEDRWQGLRTLGPRAGNFAHGWTPLATADGPRFVSWWEPTEVWRQNDPADGFERVALRMAPHLAERFVAGSQGVAVPGGFLLMVNETVVFDDNALTFARFVRLDEGFQIDAISPQFWVAERGRDRMSGLTQQGEWLVIGLTSGAQALLATVALDEVLRLMIPVSAPGKDRGATRLQ
jgi:hypothetical protein